ncbi:MAG: FAD-binding oxidoreductase [Actinomycetota bacterium]|nr:FAD-binding oxidoreductase [Actinomycetota bacterium]MDA2971124.1 FAD-binding oxidoreductase [Actinomycetota bacterium]MDA3000875.1 FAD-binding oxidoreductase [Actinomycetota bacterium]
MREITEPIELVVGPGESPSSRWTSTAVADHVVSELSAICATSTEVDDRVQASRDWWPLTMRWALRGEVPAICTVVCRPNSTDDVARIASICHRERVPLTPVGGRSGVCGAAIPRHGGVVLDMSAMQGVNDVDDVSLVVDVRPGTFGPDLEEHLSHYGMTIGHYPQSFDIATVGGWVACRGAGQYSTRYGKVEDMVVGLEVVLADGRVVRTGGAPAASAGPDLTQLFLGSEGTLGIVTRVWLRAHPSPVSERRAAYAFRDFESGLDSCRRVMQRGGTPAVLRLYDAEESARGRGGDGSDCVLLVLDEGDVASVDASMSIVDEEALATDGCRPLDSSLVDAWLEHRNDTSGLQALTRKNYVIDTMEIAGPWLRLAHVFHEARRALTEAGARTATCHLSHSYTDGACLYFTFAARPTDDDADFEGLYRRLWDAGTRAVLSAGGNLSHHHGIGLNRAPYVREALGTGLDVLIAIKRALDPHGILNPGKMGLDDAFAT